MLFFKKKTLIFSFYITVVKIERGQMLLSSICLNCFHIIFFQSEISIPNFHQVKFSLNLNH